MDVSSFESNSHGGLGSGQLTDAGNEACVDHQFPDLSIKHLIARLILARGAVVRATNPDLADEYLKFASVFQWSEPGIARRLNGWAKA
jgi:hypothetical protein